MVSWEISEDSGNWMKTRSDTVYLVEGWQMEAPAICNQSSVIVAWWQEWYSDGMTGQGQNLRLIQSKIGE